MRGRCCRTPPSRSSASSGTTWSNVASTTVDANGDFQAQVALTPGDYRARVSPGRGFVPGVTPVLKVGPA